MCFTPLDYTFVMSPSEMYYLQFTNSCILLSWMLKLNGLLCFWHCAGVVGPIFFNHRWLLVFTHHKPPWSVFIPLSHSGKEYLNLKKWKRWWLFWRHHTIQKYCITATVKYWGLYSCLKRCLNLTDFSTLLCQETDQQTVSWTIMKRLNSRGEFI